MCRADLLAVLLLAMTGVAIGLPVLTGGYATYLDNPAHLAEIRDLAGPARGGWSDLAYCGYPLGLLHSPLWFGLLALWTRAGLPLAPAYAFFLWFSFCLPACALYAVCRRRAPPFPSATLAFLLLIQRPATLGAASAFGGMWTFYLAAAGIILLTDRLARPNRSPRERMEIALLGAGIVLTHLFVALTLLYLCAVHFAWSLRRRGSVRAVVATDAMALAAIALLISCPYWLSGLLAHGGMRSLRWDLTAPQILRLFVLPLDMKRLLLEGGRPSSQLLYTDALPLLLLPLAGFAGLALLLRGRRLRPDRAAPEKTDWLPVYGISLSAVLLLLLLVIKVLPAPLLGISSWRQLYFVRVGFCLAALPLLSRWNRLPALPRSRAWAVLLALAGCFSGLWWGRPLRDEVPRPQGSEMAEVRALWGWLRQNRDDRWGRIYLQDTFMAEPRESELAEAHILALTAGEAGVRQLGAFYGVMPFPTAGWTNDLLFAGSREPSDRKRDLRTALSMTNCTHLVLSSPREIAALDDGVFLRRLWRGGRFAVYEVPGAAAEWVQPLTDGLRVWTKRYASGQIEIGYDARGPGASFLVKEANHPFWRVEGTSPPILSSTASGLMQLTQLPSGRHSVLLRWKPPSGPLWLAGMGWIALIAWSFPPRFHRARPSGS